MRTLRSDNNAGLCPEALLAIQKANDESHQHGYGDDVFTRDAKAAFGKIFGPDCGVFFVATGTAANTLAIAALTEPWQTVLCHSHAHLNDNESTAPERITHCRTMAIHTESSKLTPDKITQAISHQRGDVHQPQPGVVTISNPSEFGTIYSPEEMATICKVAHETGFRVHVDGARFANAVASLGCDPKALSIEAGVDALSFGGTKNGMAGGEAILLFAQGDGQAHAKAMAALPFHRKGTGHLLSKHRFLSAPFTATLRNGVWLKHAAHANAMARRLADGLSAMGMRPRFECQTNGVFVSITEQIDQALQAAGHEYYRLGDAAWNMVRLMCSFDTDPKEIDAFLADAQKAC